MRGFGAVFTDVDQQDGSGFGNKKSRRSSTSIEYFDARNRLLFRGIVPASPGDATFSFFGIVFGEPTDKAIIARVRIITGNSAPGPDDGKTRHRDDGRLYLRRATTGALTLELILHAHSDTAFR